MNIFRVFFFVIFLNKCLEVKVRVKYNLLNDLIGRWYYFLFLLVVGGNVGFLEFFLTRVRIMVLI